MIEELEETQHATVVASLFDEQGKQMVGHARTRLASWRVPASWADADDIVQTACVKVLATPRPIRHVRAYLYRVIEREVDLAAKRYRAARRDDAAGGDELFAVKLAARHPDVCDAAAERTDLSAALRALPPQQRTAVFYSKVMGLTQAETAQAMGKNSGTVATHVSRAVTALKISLGVVCIVLVGATAAWLGAIRRTADPAAGGEVPPGAGGLLGVWVIVLAGVAVLLGAGCAVVKYRPRPPLLLSPERLGTWILWRLGNVVRRWLGRGVPKTRKAPASGEPQIAADPTALRPQVVDRAAEHRPLDRMSDVTPMPTKSEQQPARADPQQFLEKGACAETDDGSTPHFDALKAAPLLGGGLVLALTSDAHGFMEDIGTYAAALLCLIGVVKLRPRRRKHKDRAPGG
ncbi:RNA polymerase sigma factor [Streptomyces sp. NPDC058644]|uniref:RNA polymerase sigma factor n=1 Tax=unclassified Streptomyces TaxID=2593676 RepID=UPI00365880B1